MMVIVDVDGFADAMTDGTSGMLNAASQIAQATFSTPWLWIPFVVLMVVFVVLGVVLNMKHKK